MKADKFTVQVPVAYQTFLANLPLPLAVGEMRTLKDDKQTALRKLLSQDVGGLGL